MKIFLQMWRCSKGRRERDAKRIEIIVNERDYVIQIKMQNKLCNRGNEERANEGEVEGAEGTSGESLESEERLKK